MGLGADQCFLHCAVPPLVHAHVNTKLVEKCFVLDAYTLPSVWFQTCRLDLLIFPVMIDENFFLTLFLQLFVFISRCSWNSFHPFFPPFILE